MKHSLCSRMWILGLAVIFCGNAEAGNMAEYKAQLASFFRPFHYLPLVTPEGHKVGDVIDVRDFTVLKGQEECFPGLTPSRQSEFSMPALLDLNERTASVFIRLGELIGLNASGGAHEETKLNFEDVSITGATVSELRDSLNLEECPELKVLFEAPRELPVVFGRYAVVILNTMNARVNTVFSYSQGVDGEVELLNLRRILGNVAGDLLELTPNAASGLGLSKTGVHIRMSSPRVQTVAFRPSSIIRRYLGGANDGSGGVEVIDFDETNELHLEALDRFGRAWAQEGSQ